MEDAAHAHAVDQPPVMPRSFFSVLSTAALLTLLYAGFAGPAYALPHVRGALNPLRATSSRSLNPFSQQLAQAEPAPVRKVQARSQRQPPAIVAPASGTCSRDEQCPDQTICTDGTCRPLDRPIRALLFRKEGPKTAFWPFYFTRTGTPGYRVFAPLYWHFWSVEDKARVVAPFYFRFENYQQQKRSTALWLGPLITWSSQPDASSWGVWPLIYRSTKFGWAAPLLGSFKINNPDEGRSFGIYGFLYYWRRQQQGQEATDVVFPLVWSFRSQARSTTVGFPLLWAWRRGSQSSTLLIPLFFRSQGPRNALTVSPFGYRSAAGANRRGANLWLHWYGRSKTDNFDVGFPLLWSFRGPKSNTTVVFPLVWHFGSATRETTVVGPYVQSASAKSGFRALVPFFFAYRDLEDKTGWGLIAPLAFWRTRSAGDEALVVTPLGGYSRNRKAGTSALTLLVPPVVSRRSPRGKFDLLFPLYYRGEDRVERSQSLWALLFYHRTDLEGQTTTLFPFFWRFHDARNKASATALLPFFFHRKSPSDHLIAVGAGAMAYYRNRGAAGKSAGLFPLAFFGRHHDRRHAIVFPLLWHFSSAQKSSTLALPLFGHWRNRGEANTAVFPLLYFQGHTERSAYRIQFPLYWYFHNKESETRTHVLGPAFYRSKPAGWSGGVFPLVFAGNSAEASHFVLAPVLWHFRDKANDRSRTVVGPYMHARNGQETTDALFPLLYYRRGAKPGGDQQTSFTLFPLLHFNRTTTSQLFLSPLAMGKRTPERKLGFVGPYFWYESKQVAASGVLPLWWDLTNKQRQERTRVLGPWVAIDRPDARARFLFPLWGHYTADRGTSKEDGTYVFPTFFHQRNSDGYALDALAPLFWYSHGPHSRALQLGPWFSRTTDTTHTQGFVPLYVYRKTPERSLLLTPLGFRHHDFAEKTATTWMALLFYRSSSADGHSTVLFPLWYAGRDKQRSHQVLFPLFWRFADGRAKTSTTLLGPLFARRNGSMKTWGIFPLAWVGRDAEQQAGSNALLPAFYHSYGPNRSALLTPLFGLGRSPKASWWYVPPVVRRVTSTTSLTVVAPLGFLHNNRASETRTSFFLPLLHFSRSSPEKALSSWLGVFWHRRGIASSTNVLFPLFFDHHSFHESRTTGVLPVFLRHHNAATQTSYSFAPFFYRRSTPTEGTTVLFPLYWDFKSPGHRTQFLFPLFAHLERATWKGTYVFPNIWYRSGKGADAGTSRLFVFPFWESEVKRRGDYLWEVLLGLFGYERQGRNRFVKLLFIPFEVEPAPRAQTAWYGKAPRKPRLEPGRGFSGHIW